MYTLRQKYLMLTGKGQTGGKYCNAIDENPYDNNEWSNYMPSSGYSFRTLKSGKVQTTYEHYFACYDGYDSSCDEPEIFNSLEIAINSLWIRQALDKVYNLVHALQHSINVKTSAKFDDSIKTFNKCDSLIIDTVFCKQNHRASYNPVEIYKTLIDDIYPSLSGTQ